MFILFPPARLFLYDSDWATRGLAHDVTEIPRVDVFLYLQMQQYGYWERVVVVK